MKFRKTMAFVLAVFIMTVSDVCIIEARQTLPTDYYTIRLERNNNNTPFDGMSINPTLFFNHGLDGSRITDFTITFTLHGLRDISVFGDVIVESISGNMVTVRKPTHSLLGSGQSWNLSIVATATGEDIYIDDVEVIVRDEDRPVLELPPEIVLPEKPVLVLPEDFEPPILDEDLVEKPILVLPPWFIPPSVDGEENGDIEDDTEDSNVDKEDDIEDENEDIEGDIEDENNDDTEDDATNENGEATEPNSPTPNPSPTPPIIHLPSSPSLPNIPQLPQTPPPLGVIHTPTEDKITVPLGSDTIYRNNLQIHTNAPAYQDQEVDAIMIPIRFIAYALDMNVLWQEHASTATIFAENKLIHFINENPIKQINGVLTKIQNENGIPVNSKIREDRMFIPAHAIADAFDLEIEWHESSKTVVFYINR